VNISQLKLRSEKFGDDDYDDDDDDDDNDNSNNNNNNNNNNKSRVTIVRISLKPFSCRCFKMTLRNSM